MPDRLHSNPVQHGIRIFGVVLYAVAVIVQLAYGYLVDFNPRVLVFLGLLLLLGLRTARLAVFPYAVLERDRLVIRKSLSTVRIPLAEIATIDHRIAKTRNTKGNWFNPAITKTDGTELVLTNALYRVDSRYQWRVQDFVEEVERRMPVRARQARGASTPI